MCVACCFVVCWLPFVVRCVLFVVGWFVLGVVSVVVCCWLCWLSVFVCRLWGAVCCWLLVDGCVLCVCWLVDVC